MIIPVRCFTCNNILASKYNLYIELLKLIEDNQDNPEMLNKIKENVSNSLSLTSFQKDDSIEKDDSIDKDHPIEKKTTPSQTAFELLNLRRYCCRRHLLSHVDLVDKI